MYKRQTQYIPKTIEEDGRTLTLQTVNWQTDNTANMDGYAVGDRFTACLLYTSDVPGADPKWYEEHQEQQSEDMTLG